MKRTVFSVGILWSGLVTAPVFAAPDYQSIDYGRSYGSTQDKPAFEPPNKPAVKANVQWELYQQIEQMQQELARMRGTIEEQAVAIERLKRQQKQQYNDMDQRLTKLQGGSVQTAATEESEDADADQTNDQNLSVKQMYNKAIVLMREQKHQQSIDMLKRVQKKQPDSAYAPNVEYWLGDLYMALSPPNYDAAKQHFVTLLTKHKTHPKAADGMYKLGAVFNAKGEKQKALVTLKKVLVDHPKTSASKLAVKLLRTIDVDES